MVPSHLLTGCHSWTRVGNLCLSHAALGQQEPRAWAPGRLGDRKGPPPTRVLLAASGDSGKVITSGEPCLAKKRLALSKGHVTEARQIKVSVRDE